MYTHVSYGQNISVTYRKELIYMKISQKEYGEMVKKASPASKSYKNIPLAFLIGGLICALGEGLIHLYMSFDMDKELAATLTSVTLIFASALLTGLDLYNKIAKVAGAGTLVPITGFANSVVAPALEFKSEGLIAGLGAKLFVISGPVLAYGLLASVVYGIIYYFFI